MEFGASVFLGAETKRPFAGEGVDKKKESFSPPLDSRPTSTRKGVGGKGGGGGGGAGEGAKKEKIFTSDHSAGGPPAANLKR